MRFLISLLAVALAAAEPLRICATVPELGAIARAVVGDGTIVTVFAAPGDDPHRVDARPSFVVELAQADVLLSVGCELESGWLPPLLANARNRRLDHLEAAALVEEPIGLPAGTLDRSAGHVHPGGNPHLLFDPVAGAAVASELARRLDRLRPDPRWAAQAGAFRARLGEALVGPALAARLDPFKLARLARHGRLAAFLAEQGLTAELGGWCAAVAPTAGAQLASDHDLYPYLARACGWQITVFLEPKPGVPPSARHLTQVAAQMREQGVRAVLHTPYFDARPVATVAEAAGARVAQMAHQAGALPGTDDYVAWLDANIRAVVEALR
jgi:zinc/manganese transport system substrate-binding protein